MNIFGLITSSSTLIKVCHPKRSERPAFDLEPARVPHVSLLRHGIHTASKQARNVILSKAKNLLLLLQLSLFTLTAHAAHPRVLVLHLDDTIQPIGQAFLDRGLSEAAAAHADALLIEINTPGGLLSSTRSIVHSILASPVPVIVYVAPSGSRAGSAGFFILEAADIAAMAPGTNAGAAHPVVEGTTLDPIMKQKLENDTTAFLRSYVSVRKRNVDAAQDAVLNSKSYTATEALDLKLIDRIAPSERALLDNLDGTEVHRFDGKTLTLHTKNAELLPIDLTLREQILDRLIDPNFAVLALILGALLIYLEFNTPGTIIPGALGTLLVVTALFALNLLPIHYASLALCVGGLVLLLLEAKASTHGILAAAGTIALVFGLLTLVEAPTPELSVHFATALAVGTAFGLITFFLVRIALRARRNKVLTGPEAMVGAVVIAQEPFGGTRPRGQVLVRGELWFAESNAPLGKGEYARVTAVRALTLLVERMPGPTLASGA
jgi:membrane-bound serine protease (ClpP class)